MKVGVDEVVLAVNYQPELMSAVMREWEKKVYHRQTSNFAAYNIFLSPI